MLPREPYKKFAVIVLYVAVAVISLLLFAKYLWRAVAPFIIAYLFAECFKPVVKYSEKNKRFPKKSFVLFVILLTATSVVMLIYGLARQTAIEINGLVQSLSAAVNKMKTDEKYASELIERINSFVPFADIRSYLWKIREDPEGRLWSAFSTYGQGISDKLLSLVGGAAKWLPNFLLSFVVIIISTYYFAIDRVKINCFFLSLFPKTVQPLLKSVKDLLADTVGKYLRAYGLLFSITFGELLVAFWILRVEYAFVIALVISLIDILPIFGAGIVLVPWGVICIASQNFGRGIALIAIYAVITVIRQIIEPKIVGRFIGLSPLGTLAAMYVGLKLLGVLGIFIFPIAAIVIKKLLVSKEESSR